MKKGAERQESEPVDVEELLKIIHPQGVPNVSTGDEEEESAGSVDDSRGEDEDGSEGDTDSGALAA